MKTVITGLLALTLMAPGLARAQDWYLGTELGGHAALPLDTRGLSNDRASVCDELINPMYATVWMTPGYWDYNCTGPDRGDNWINRFGQATGLQTSWALGYRLGDGPRWLHLRMELEYFYRSTLYDQTIGIGAAAGTDIVAADKLNQELRTATDHIASVSTHAGFANLYWELRSGLRFTPYIGIGAGVGSTSIGYGSLWSRNPDPAAIVTGAGLPNAAEIRQNLAGTTSSFQGVVDDTVTLRQVLVGVDYRLTENVSLGIEARRVQSEAFESDQHLVWDPLRSHVPNLRLDGSEPVYGRLVTGESVIWAGALSLKYHF